MNGATATHEDQVLVDWLKNYKSTSDLTKARIDELKAKRDKLTAAVDEANKLDSEIQQLSKHLRENEKFLINMNQAVIRLTGEPISNGELFEQKKEESEKVN
ncbi:MAG: hypothetical protein AB1394_07490 [Bacteroidota bacterium]